ncbi:MAG TPA: alkaline phosphatase family protein, partial [Planctomycetota bacterium]|nr:alkaline phosphatase family protein [Planctomycetota bacterium]
MRHLAALLLLLMGCGAAAPRPADAPPAPAPRAEWLRMFARGDVPGRSGQVFLVAREGDILTTSDPHHRYMHGSPWDDDARLPLLLHGAPFIRPGRYAGSACQQDIAPTLAALLGATLPTATGHVLDEALVAGAGRPRVAVVLVADGLRADALDRHAEVVPTLTRLRAEGAWFPDARIDVLPTLTAVGHANIGTGTEPRFHGI